MEGTDVGQSHFGHPDLTNLGQSTFGQSISGSGCVSWPQRVGPNAEKIGPPKGGARRVGPQRVDCPKFRAFFPSPATKFVLFFPLWRSTRGILVVFGSARALKCARLGSRATRPGRGSHTTTRELQTCTFQGKRAKFWAVRRRWVQWSGVRRSPNPQPQQDRTTQQQQQQQQQQPPSTTKFGQNTEH